MKTLKFSVLIPSYNGEKVIGAAIKSILNQTYRNFEIIICDDVSKDSTVNTVKAFKNKRIKIFQNTKNLGTCGNLNECLKHATGDIIYLLGQDDLLSKDALECTYKAFMISPDIGAVTRPYRWYDEDLSRTVRARPPLNDKKDEVVKITDSYDRIVAVFKNLDSLSALAYRRSFMKKPFHEDIFPTIADPFAAIFKHHPIVFLKNYVSSVSMQQSQCRHVSSIYDKSPVLSWAQLFSRNFPENKFDGLRSYCLQNFVASNYVGLAQIKNYSRHKYLYTLREIYYLVKFNRRNAVNPLFWIFAFGAIITPPFALVRMIDWYKKGINASLLKNIKFKAVSS